MSSIRIAYFTFLGILTVGACGGTSMSGTSSGGTTGAGGSEATGTSSSTTAATSTASASSTTATGQGGAGGSAPMPVMSCSEIPATECFSSFDCPDAADRCENRGTAELTVPCCVKGARGTGKLGESCTGENDCVSALCLGDAPKYQCTDRCKSAVECPASLPKCITIAFSGSSDKFCTP